MNNHFITYHMYDLIKKQGPLRYYSCRSLERTIKKSSNLCKSKSRPQQENENLLQRYNFFKEFQQQQAKESLLPRRQENPDAFLDHFNNPEGIVPQFLKRFEDINLNTTPGMYGVEMRKVVEAMQRFYHQTNRVVDTDIEPEVRLAAQMISNGFLIQSKFHRTHQPQLVRSSNIVIFEAPESAR